MTQYDMGALMGRIDDKFVQEALRSYGQGAAGSRESRRSLPAPRRFSRTLLAAAVIVSLFAALCVGAYALNLFGIAELWKGTSASRSPLPAEALELIEPHSEAARAADWSAEVTETLCTDHKLIFTVVVTGGDKYFVAPTDASEWDSLQTHGLDGAGTLEEHAAAEGKKLLFVGAGPDYEQLGVGTAGMSFTYTGDDQLAILVNAQKDLSFSSIETRIQITARESGSNDIQRLFIPVTLSQGETKLVGSYAPLDPDAVPGFHVGELRVTETSLGYDFAFSAVPQSEEASRELMRIEFSGFENGGNTCGPDPTGETLLTMMTGTLGDTLIAHFDDWDKQPIGEIEFVKK